MKNKTSNQPDAFAWENMSKAQKYLVVGATLFVLTAMAKSCVDASPKSFDYSQCTSSAIADKIYYASGGSIDSQEELDFVANSAAAQLKECQDHGWK